MNRLLKSFLHASHDHLRIAPHLERWQSYSYLLYAQESDHQMIEPFGGFPFPLLSAVSGTSKSLLLKLATSTSEQLHHSTMESILSTIPHKMQKYRHICLFSCVFRHGIMILPLNKAHSISISSVTSFCFSTYFMPFFHHILHCKIKVSVLYCLSL